MIISKVGERISVEGKLEFWEQSGGFLALEATIDADSIADWIARAVGNKPPDKLDRGGNVIQEGEIYGRWRVTLERIE